MSSVDVAFKYRFNLKRLFRTYQPELFHGINLPTLPPYFIFFEALCCISAVPNSKISEPEPPVSRSIEAPQRGDDRLEPSKLI